MNFVELDKENFDERTNEWLKFIPNNTSNYKFEFNETALFVIDMQNYFLDDKSSAYFNNSKLIISNINKLILFFKQNLITIFYSIHFNELNENQKANSMVNWWKKLPQKSSKYCELYDEVIFIKNSNIIYKETYSIFDHNNLEITLKSKNIKNIIVSGLKTNLCCESTARDGFLRDFNVLFIADATATNNEFMHLASLTNLSYGFAKIAITNNIHKFFI